MLLLLAQLAHAGPAFAGLEYKPLSRADLDWVDDGRTSGLAVGEYDGIVAPGLAAYFGGWLSHRTALSGSLGIARLANSTLVDEIWHQRHWGVIRPGIDLRVAIGSRPERTPWPYVLGGLYGNIPSARDVSNGFTKPEQKAADEAAGQERLRLAGVGVRTGFGVDYPLTERQTVLLGGLYTVDIRRSIFVADDTSAVTSWMATSAMLLVTVQWPGQPSDDAAEDSAEDPTDELVAE